MGAIERFQKRGATVYRLASFVKWAAFRFLAITTGIFIWVSFSGYFSAKVGPVAAPILSAFAVVIMFALIDKGLDALMEFLADEKLSPSIGSSDAEAANRRRFMRIALLLAVLRLVATGTTSVWGSFEIAEFVTEKPDERAIVQQISGENASLEAARNSLAKQVERARKEEATKVRQAKEQGRSLVEAALAKHPRQEVRDGVRHMLGWYATTPKLKKYRDGVQSAIADSARLVQAEMNRVQELQAQLVLLETEGLKAANEIKAQLAAVAVSHADQYEQTKARRSNFLIIADLIAVVFGLLAIWVRATFRAAVGQESVLEERTLEGILWAAIQKASNTFLEWLERLVGVDINGDGKVGAETPVSPYRRAAEKTTETIGATAETAAETRRKIGFFKDEEVGQNAVSNKVAAVSVDLNDVAKQLERARGKYRSYRSRVSRTPETIELNGETKINPAYRTALAGLKRAEAEISQLEKLLG